MCLQLADVAGAVLVAGQIRGSAAGGHQGEGHGIRSASVPASSSRLQHVEVLAGGRTGGSLPAGVVLAVPGQPLDSDGGRPAPARLNRVEVLASG